jgi:hypothetical protein
VDEKQFLDRWVLHWNAHVACEKMLTLMAPKSILKNRESLADKLWNWNGIADVYLPTAEAWIDMAEIVELKLAMFGYWRIVELAEIVARQPIHLLCLEFPHFVINLTKFVIVIFSLSSMCKTKLWELKLVGVETSYEFKFYSNHSLQSIINASGWICQTAAKHQPS